MTMSATLIPPHGGELVDAIVSAGEVDALRAAAAGLPSLELDARELADLELIATGAVSPLRGFLGREDYQSVVQRMRLSNGTVWPLPLTLAVSDEQRAVLEVGREVALRDSSGSVRAVLRISDLFERDPLEEARRVYRTESSSHPGVAYLLSRPRWLVGGEVRALPLPSDLPFAKHRLTPRSLREQIRSLGWRRIAGFQTRNPIHRAHEHITKLALELVDGIVIHPLVGETTEDDVPASVRFLAYELLIEKYYPKSRTLLAAFPAAMRYAGPREAIFHALVRKNYGITHLIVGRDHAGVGSFYGPFEAQQLFDAFDAAELGVIPLKFDATFFCRACGSLASTRTCPHEPAHRLDLAGRTVREILRAGGQLPVEFTRPEIAEILRKHYASTGATPSATEALAAAPVNGAGPSHAPPELRATMRHGESLAQPEPAVVALGGATAGDRLSALGVEALLATQSLASLAKHEPDPHHAYHSVHAVVFGQVPVPEPRARVAPSHPESAAAKRRALSPRRGFILWFTGLSGAGKSTLAREIAAQLAPTAKLEVLDGDEVRTHLSKGLGFSREDRDTNIRRIGYVARLLARNGVPAIAAAISPYADTRAEVRGEAARDGIPFIEVHVHAELSALVERDVKGLYKKALAGEIAHFTGVSDPYEPPQHAEVKIRSDLEEVRESAAKILAALHDCGLIGEEVEDER
jgi:sulfate adenylyltransferase